MQVVSPKSWLPLASLGSLVVVVVWVFMDAFHHRRGSRGTDLPASCAASVKAQGSYLLWMSGWGCVKGLAGNG